MDSEEIVLSIIVPVYNMNRDGLLQDCVDSLIGQSAGELWRYEVILVDDCSTDDSLKVLREYEKRCPGLVRVIEREKNGRQGAARNTGLKAARGKWIGFVDSDDWVHKDMYRKLVERAQETGADCATCLNLIVKDRNTSDPKGELQGTNFSEGEITGEQTEKSVCLGENMWNKIYLRSTLVDNGLFFPEGIFYEDNAVAAYFYIMSERIAVVSEPLYYYYVNPGSTCNTMTSGKIADRLAAAEYFLDTAKRLKLYDRNPELFRFGYFCQAFVMGIPHVWKLNAGMPERYGLIKRIRAAVNRNCPDMRNDRLFLQYYPELLRSYGILRVSAALYMLYHYYREMKSGK
jgi:glycosyltransferase involved in cell wall biosynthesis